MAEYTATITWNRDGAPFTDNKYSRAHRWHFDGGIDVPASASPHVVPLPYSVENAVDPEEAFVASLSSCHMLTFIWLAARQGFIVDSYRDDAVGVMGKDAAGKISMTRITLRPDVRFSGDRLPTADDISRLHHRAHEQCFIASSVKTDVRCEPVGISA